MLFVDKIWVDKATDFVKTFSWGWRVLHLKWVIPDMQRLQKLCWDDLLRKLQSLKQYFCWFNETILLFTRSFSPMWEQFCRRQFLCMHDTKNTQSGLIKDRFYVSLIISCIVPLHFGVICTKSLLLGKRNGQCY